MPSSPEIRESSPQDTSPTDELTSTLALPWILRLRYGLAATELAIFILAATVARAHIKIVPAVCIVAVTLLSNILEKRARTRFALTADRTIAALFCLDILCLSAVLMLTGGPTNPFSLLYLVQITLSATILNKHWTWFLGILSIICFGSLFQYYVPIPLLEAHHFQEGRNLHLLGMWIGFAVAAFLIALFSGKISEALREREVQLLALQHRLAAKERLASLATLAAGAAHELSTPLATIAVVAKDLENLAARLQLNEAVADDTRLIRSEVERCRHILQGMSAQGAEVPGERPTAIPVAALLSSLQEQFPEPARSRLRFARLDPSLQVVAPAQALIQSLAALSKNAFEASADQTPVSIHVNQIGDAVCFAVQDEGPGISDQVLGRIGEPFFTTKPAGKGMGLGAFLVRAFAEGLGGSLRYESQIGAGTKALLEIPLNSLRRIEPASAR